MDNESDRQAGREPGPGTSEGREPGTDGPFAPQPAGGEDAPREPSAAPGDESRTSDAEGKKRRIRRRVLRCVLAALTLLLLPLLTAEAALRVNYTGTPKPGTTTRHQDALWLGHTWVDGRKTDQDVRKLAQRLRTTGIRDLFVHSGPLEDDGTLPDSAYPKARWLISAVHRELPGVRVQAWLGDELATESPDGMHLERAATREAIVASTRRVLAAGYDGVHFDLEPLHSGDRHYLSLLDRLHALTHARHALLSVAAHQIDPLPGFHAFWGATTNHPKWWSQAYFGQVARRVDQIAVMSYDTMQPLQSLYGGYVAQQTSLALEVTPDTTGLLMGLPFYHENRFGHWAHAETVPAAVRGVRLGLSRTDADRARFGVALYVDFAATDADWRAYEDDWVR
ncbi:glycosyl hydrolase family 18 protein [Streptomyces sp. MMG1121]|uniref:glycosyl hydrolase family 18 protein n=1 Tax=Streptomyces sp. MMG1121 TaxID=1415544 RepID=UPI0006AE7A15|nr:glycosyl hydrolase family 18 protein [Streptomyces sp. MMG1121]KOV63730.1 membrane protein [Streptomyces sp. MMG1121]